MHPLRHILISGTTSGIGLGLLEAYDRDGILITAVNRRRDTEKEASYSRVRFEQIDVRDSDSVASLVRRLAESNELPDLFLLNAGTIHIDNDAGLQLQTFRETFEINYYGVMNFVAPLTRLGIWPKKTVVMAISSMSTLVPNPHCFGYYAGKKVLTDSFRVLSSMYAKTNLQFKCLILGPVSTGFNRDSGKLPSTVTRVRDMLSVPTTAAVNAIREFACKDKAELLFPFRSALLYRMLWILKKVLPGFYSGRKNLDGSGKGKDHT